MDSVFKLLLVWQSGNCPFTAMYLLFLSIRLRTNCKQANWCIIKANHSSFQANQTQTATSQTLYVISSYEIENMYRVSINLQKHEWKFGRTRNAVGTRATGECFHSFFKISQTFMSVSITRQKHGEHVFYFLKETLRRRKGKQLVNVCYQNVNALCLRHCYVNSACLFCVSSELQKHNF